MLVVANLKNSNAASQANSDLIQLGCRIVVLQGRSCRREELQQVAGGQRSWYLFTLVPSFNCHWSPVVAAVTPISAEEEMEAAGKGNLNPGLSQIGILSWLPQL